MRERQDNWSTGVRGVVAGLLYNEMRMRHGYEIWYILRERGSCIWATGG